MVVVLANGCFDPLHYGHILHLEAARALGTRLVVGLTNDAFVNKGPERPVFSVDQREHCLLALRCVYQVIRCDNLLEALASIRPDVLAKGRDYRGKIERRHMDYCRKHGIRIRYTSTPKFSSTDLLSHYARSR